MLEPVTLAQSLEATAAAFPAKTAIVAGGERWTWADVRTRSLEFAAFFEDLRVAKGDRIAVWLPNDPAWMFVWCGASYLGAVVVPISTRSKASEARHILASSSAETVVISPDFLERDFEGLLREALFDGTSRGPEVSAVRNVLSIGRAIDGLAAPLAPVPISVSRVADLVKRSAGVDARDDCVIVFTSGTTGAPKGAVHSSVSALGQARVYTEWFRIAVDSCILAHMPFFHVAGLLCALAPAVQTGAQIVVMERWNPRQALTSVADERVTHLMGAPTHFLDLVEAQAELSLDLSNLAYAWIGGASTPADVIDSAIEVLGLRSMMCVYGMTEAPMFANSNVDDPREVVHEGKVRPDARIADVIIVGADGDVCAPGEEGEIRVKGDIVLKSYFGLPAETAAAFDTNGYFCTGDLGAMDAEGFLTITGRLKDMFIVGGTNAYPAEIEAVLNRSPGVRQSQVVGVPDPRLGEVGVAFVERAPGSAVSAEEIIAWAKHRLADFKVPRRVEFVTEWPTTPSGKIQKFKLREASTDRPPSEPVTSEKRSASA